MNNLERRGHLRDTAHRALIYMPIRPRLSVGGMLPQPPPRASNEAAEAPIMDQWRTSSCTGHGTSQALQPLGLGFVASPDDIYRNIRCYERRSLDEHLADSGAMPSSISWALENCGVRAMKPLANRYSDVDPATVNREPTETDLAVAGQRVLSGFYSINPTDPDAVPLVKLVLAARWNVGLGWFVDSGVERAHDNWDPMVAPTSSVNLKDKQGGGHFTCLNAYAETGLNATTMSGPQSWGLGGAPALVDSTACPNGYGHYRIVLEPLIAQGAIWNIIAFPGGLS